MMTQTEPSTSLKTTTKLCECLTAQVEEIQSRKKMDKIEDWGNRKLMRLNKEKHKVLRNNLMQNGNNSPVKGV